MSCINIFNMKKSTFTFVTLILIGGVFFSSCNTPVQEMEMAKNYILNETDSSSQGNLLDMQAYLQGLADTITVNEQRIADLKEKIQSEKGAVQAEYQQKITDLELKNMTLSKRINSFQAEGIEKWDSVKNEISQEVNDLSSTINDLTAPFME